MTSILHVLLAVCLTAVAASAIDDGGASIHSIRSRRALCDKKWTDIHENHTMCFTPVGQEVTLSQATKDAVVALHNKYRSEVKPPAANMIKLIWDDDVAEVASRWAAMCKGGHDKHRQVPTLPGIGIGQNGASGYSSLNAATTGWYNEVTQHEYGVGSTTGNWAHVGHYTQVVLARSTRIGCGEAICGGHKSQYCNYVFGQLGSEVKAPYLQGTPCSACPGNCDSTGALCEFNGLTCLNSGQFDIKTGTCKCRPMFTGNACQTYYQAGCPESDKWFCNEEKYQSSGNCPYLFGICKHSCGDKACQNGGTLNYKTCKCSCNSPYQGEFCETADCPDKDKWFCNDKRYQSRGNCPYLFGVCKHSCGDKACQNGGALNYRTCVCSCPAPYKGDTCETAECPKADKWFCNDKRYQSKANCPYFFGICKNNCGEKTCVPGQGTLDLSTCNCDCKKDYIGDLCQTRHCPNPDASNCGAWMKQYCSDSDYSTWARGNCPKTCELC